MIVRRSENTPLASVTQEDQKKYGHLISDPFDFINDEFGFAANLWKPGAGADAQLAACVDCRGGFCRARPILFRYISDMISRLQAPSVIRVF